ncbi:MAG: glycoside hydrolase, partial [Acidobacteria bacterium]|nr:glycoside hydrolase [Acidobacteriota bacterium]
AAEAHIFQPAPAYRVRRDTNTDTPIPPDEPLGQNPPAGAILDYILPHAVTGRLRLEILDDQGKLVRQYDSGDRPEEEEKKELIPTYWLRPWRALATGAGMHRWIWDLRYPSPLASEHEYPIAAVPHNTPRYPLGPSALPGQYTVRLTSEGRTSTTSLVVKMDPRVNISSEDLKKKFDLETRLAAAVSESSTALIAARSLEKEIEQLPPNSTKPALSDSIKGLRDKISALLERPPEGATASEEPVLTTQSADLLSLYKGVEKSDAAPTLAETEASSRSLSQLQGLLQQWNTLKSKDLVELNRQLESSGLPPVRLNTPENNPDRGDRQ